MTKVSLLLPLLLLAPCLAADTAAPTANAAEKLMLKMPEKTGTDACAVEMFRLLVKQTPKGNVCFSPAAAEQVLDILTKAAERKTKVTLEKVPVGRKGVPSSLSPDISSALLVNKSFRPSAGFYTAADTLSVDFAAADTIRKANDWCNRATKSQVKTIWNAKIKPQQFLVLNTLYFQENWETPFDKELSSKRVFTQPSGKRTVKMMTTEDTESILFAKGKNWRAVAKSYKAKVGSGERGFFIAVMPNGDAREFIDTLTPEILADIRHSLGSKPEAYTTFTMPKFTIKGGENDLDAVWKTMGLSMLYEKGANFSALAPNLGPLDGVIQKCYVKVDEVGGAPARTEEKEKSPNPKEFSLNRPFLWLIGDLTTDAPPLMMGLMEEP